MSDRSLINALLWCAAVSGVVPMSAAADLLDQLEVHGFATQGFVKTSANSFFGDSENGSFEFTELGINATLEPSSSVRLSGQLLARKAGAMSDGSPRVDFAVADLSLFSSTDASVNILIGRVKNPLGLFNDTRDVAFTRPSVFLPQTIYFQSVRSLALSADGIAVRAKKFSDFGNLELQLGLGKPFVDENVEYAYLGGSFEGDYAARGASWVGRLMFETADEKWRLALSGADTSLEFQPEPGDIVPPGITEILFMVASVQYVSEEWTLSTEYVLEPNEYRGFYGMPFSGESPTLEGYYAQLNWHVTHNVDLMLRYEEGFVDREDRDGRHFEAATGLPAHSRYLKGIAVGARWDVTPDFMLSAEFQRSNGTAILSNRENPDASRTQRNWDMFSLSASYRF